MNSWQELKIGNVEERNGEPRFFNMLLRYTASRHWQRYSALKHSVNQAQLN
jgi:hypothetical protein